MSKSALGRRLPPGDPAALGGNRPAANALMGIMGWSHVNMTARHQHVTDELRDTVADQVDGLYWSI